MLCFIVTVCLAFCRYCSYFDNDVECVLQLYNTLMEGLSHMRPYSKKRVVNDTIGVYLNIIKSKKKIKTKCKHWFDAKEKQIFT